MELKKIYITMELGFCCVNFCSERTKKKTKFGRGAREVNWQIFQMKFGRHFIVSKTQFFFAGNESDGKIFNFRISLTAGCSKG